MALLFAPTLPLSPSFLQHHNHHHQISRGPLNISLHHTCRPLLRMAVACDSLQHVVGPFCPLLTAALLKRHVEHLSPKSTSKISSSPSFLLARSQIHARCLCQAEWTLTYLIRNALVERATGDLAEAFFTLALFSQKRDLGLARYCFRLSAHSALGGGRKDKKAASKAFVAWGLMESKYGTIFAARRLLRRAVELDERKAPVLRWKRIFS